MFDKPQAESACISGYVGREAQRSCSVLDFDPNSIPFDNDRHFETGFGVFERVGGQF